MTKPSQSPEKRKTLTLQTCAASSQLFFCRRLEIPADVEEDELDGYLQLQLESLSPFPLEHLQFGYAVDSDKRFAFVYSGYRRSFEGGSVSDWDKQEAVLPEFCIGVLKGGQEPEKPLLVVSESSLAYFEFDDRSTLPVYFEGFPRPLDEDGEIEDAEAAVAFGQERIDAHLAGRSLRIWESDTLVRIGRSRMRLQAKGRDEELVDAIVTRESLWQMDLRDPGKIEKAQLEERRNGAIWKAVLGMAAAFALLVLGELIWVVEKAYVNLREQWNEEQSPRVASIDSREATINQMLAFQDSDLKPFDMLIAITPFLTEAVIFTSAETNGSNGLRVNATATSNGQANQFKQRLERFVKIESVELQNVLNRPEGTTFTALLNFKPGAFQKVEEVADNG